MFNEIMRVITGRGAERRIHDRKKVRFPVRVIIPDQPMIPAVGIEISESGFSFVGKDVPNLPELNVQIDLPARSIRARVKVSRNDVVVQNGVQWKMLAVAFIGIPADDWDAVYRFINDTAEPDNKAAGELKTKLAQDDDAYRLLPLQTQKIIVQHLIDTQRLIDPGPNGTPLLKMSYLGSQRKSADSQVHRFKVHSRVKIRDEMMQYDTFFTVDDTGNVMLEDKRR